MSTLYRNAYERAARRRDAGLGGPAPALAGQRAVQDAALAARHAGFDRAAQDHTMKYERPQFAVVGEGTRDAQDRYRRNYALIDWGA